MNMAEENDSHTPEVKIPPELADRLIEGDITMADFLGLTRGTLYAIADVGYQMLTSGKLQEAKDIYEGLVNADPYDSVFHCHLAAVHHKLGEFDDALEHYNKAVTFNFGNVDALAGRGEIYYNQGRLTDAIKDLKAAIELDPEGKIASTVRARAIVIAIKELVDHHQASSGK